MPPDRASVLRGTIGRIFAREGWVRHRTLAENIMLSQLYHTTRPYDDIRREAQQLAQTFGLPGLPSGPVEALLPADLQRAACARAFMGDPALLILETPTRGVYPGIMGALVNTLRKAREREAAVLWLTTNERVWRDQALRPTQKYHMAGSQLVQLDGS
jgi:phospholipid/cholesterol/gamma-HCH transport system ATP-binding protein